MIFFRSVRPILSLLIFCWLYFPLPIQASNAIDSLTSRLQENLHDTERVKTLNILAWSLMYSNPDTAIRLSSRALSIAQASQWKIGIANCTSYLGTFNWLKGDYPKALEYYFSALQMDEKMNRESGIASNLGNIGLVYMEQRDYSKALEYYFKALKLDEELNIKNYMATCLGNIGIVYNEQGNYSKALEYYLKALKLDEELQNKNGIARHLSNIGTIYSAQGDSAMAASNMGRKLAMTDKYPKSLQYHLQAFNINKELGRKTGIAVTLGNIGSLYTTTGEFDKAEKTLKEAIIVSKEIGAKDILKDLHEIFTNLYDTLNRPAKAFEMYKLYILYKDSIDNEENTKAQTRTEMKYEYEKAELVKEQVEKEAARLLAEKTSRRDNLQYSIVLICLLVIGLIVAMLGRLSLPAKVTEGLIFFAFLIFFEFMLVLADPYIENWSGGAPGIKLLFNASIAALIFPLHSLFEAKLKGRVAKHA